MIFMLKQVNGLWKRGLSDNIVCKTMGYKLFGRRYGLPAAILIHRPGDMSVMKLTKSHQLAGNV